MLESDVTNLEDYPCVPSGLLAVPRGTVLLSRSSLLTSPCLQSLALVKNVLVASFLTETKGYEISRLEENTLGVENALLDRALPVERRQAIEFAEKECVFDSKNAKKIKVSKKESVMVLVSDGDMGVYDFSERVEVAAYKRYEARVVEVELGWERMAFVLEESPRTVVVEMMQRGSGETVTHEFEADVTSLAWTMHEGREVLGVGLRSGAVDVVLNVDDAKEKLCRVVDPTMHDKGAVQTMCWSVDETDFLFVGFLNIDADPATTYPVVTVYQLNLKSFASFKAWTIKDPCESQRLKPNRSHEFFISYFSPWKCFFITSNWSSACCLFGQWCDDDGSKGWSRWQAERNFGEYNPATEVLDSMTCIGLGARPFVQIASDRMEDRIFPLGCVLATCLERSIPPFFVLGPNKEVEGKANYPPSPALFMLTTDGTLEIVAFVDKDPDARPLLGLESKREYLTFVPSLDVVDDFVIVDTPSPSHASVDAEAATARVMTTLPTPPHAHVLRRFVHNPTIFPHLLTPLPVVIATASKPQKKDALPTGSLFGGDVPVVAPFPKTEPSLVLGSSASAVRKSAARVSQPPAVAPPNSVVPPVAPLFGASAKTSSSFKSTATVSTPFTSPPSSVAANSTSFGNSTAAFSLFGGASTGSSASATLLPSFTAAQTPAKTTPAHPNIIESTPFPSSMRAVAPTPASNISLGRSVVQIDEEELAELRRNKEELGRLREREQIRTTGSAAHARRIIVQSPSFVVLASPVARPARQTASHQNPGAGEELYYMVSELDAKFRDEDEALKKLFLVEEDLEKYFLEELPKLDKSCADLQNGVEPAVKELESQSLIVEDFQKNQLFQIVWHVNEAKALAAANDQPRSPCSADEPLSKVDVRLQNRLEKHMEALRDCEYRARRELEFQNHLLACNQNGTMLSVVAGGVDKLIRAAHERRLRVEALHAKCIANFPPSLYRAQQPERILVDPSLVSGAGVIAFPSSSKALIIRPNIFANLQEATSITPLSISSNALVETLQERLRIKLESVNQEMQRVDGRMKSLSDKRRELLQATNASRYQPPAPAPAPLAARLSLKEVVLNQAAMSGASVLHRPPSFHMPERQNAAAVSALAPSPAPVPVAANVFGKAAMTTSFESGPVVDINERSRETFDLKAALTDFYKEVNPKKLDGLDKVVDKFSSKLDELFSKLKEQYGPSFPVAIDRLFATRNENSGGGLAVAAMAPAPPATSSWPVSGGDGGFLHTGSTSVIAAPLTSGFGLAYPPATTGQGGLGVFTSVAPGAFGGVSSTSGFGAPVATGFGAAAAAPSSIRDRLISFYQQFNPSHVGSVEETLRKYQGREANLVDNLKKKYNDPNAHAILSQLLSGAAAMASVGFGGGFSAAPQLGFVGAMVPQPGFNGMSQPGFGAAPQSGFGGVSQGGFGGVSQSGFGAATKLGFGNATGGSPGFGALVGTPSSQTAGGGFGTPTAFGQTSGSFGGATGFGAPATGGFSTPGFSTPAANGAFGNSGFGAAAAQGLTGFNAFGQNPTTGGFGGNSDSFSRARR